jgi:chromate transporter
MKGDGDILFILAVQFAIMALLALGGANAVVPEMHRQAVELRGWMSEREFADMFAISQAAPGPNVMMVTLIGYHVAGIAGALVTTLAMCGPTAVLAHFLGSAWDRFKDKPCLRTNRGAWSFRRALCRFRWVWLAQAPLF